MAVSSVAKMQHNANVAVFGAGPVGLLSVMARMLFLDTST